MKKNATSICCFLFVFTLLFTSGAVSKKRCKPFLKKLHSIQAMQRQGYSVKRGQKLRVKEDKARDKWWQCEHSSLAKFTAKYSKNTKSSQRKSQNSASKSTAKKTKRKATNKQVINDIAITNISFNQTSAIVIKAKYQGDKQMAWLDFYQKPSKCKQPKNLTVFAFCNENKRKQQSLFEQVYVN
ncbi:hypothetical protein AADZ84_04640 [Colwelliaceae bacterium MEBiC 14330]